MSTNTIDTQVAVIGAGPAGAAVVLALLAKNVSVVWLCRKRESGVRVGEHLAPEGRAALVQFDLADILESPEHLSCPGIVSYWGGASAYERDYIFNPYGSGWNLDRRTFDNDLAEAARTRGAQKLDVAAVESVERSSGNWRIAFTAAERRGEVEAQFLVDATGRNASLGRRIECRLERYDRLVGFFARVATPVNDNSRLDTRLFLEPMADGWWYSLVLQNECLIAVYLTDSDLHPGGVEAAEHVWRKRFAASEATKSRAAIDAEPLEFRAAPSHSQCNCDVAGDGWLAVGDACLAFDPLAAMGITKALQDGFPAAEAIVDALDGRQATLKTYIDNQRNAFKTYLDERCKYYRQEERWPTSEFWRRRQSL